MNLQSIIVTNCIGIAMLVVLQISSYLVRQRKLPSDRIFTAMIFLTATACATETLSFMVDGKSFFGARAAAGNTVDDIARLCSYAHQFGARVYVTVNTIVYDDELEQTRQLLADLKVAQVDAILVQPHPRQGAMALVAGLPPCCAGPRAVCRRGGRDSCPGA